MSVELTATEEYITERLDEILQRFNSNSREKNTIDALRDALMQTVRLLQVHGLTAAASRLQAIGWESESDRPFSKARMLGMSKELTAEEDEKLRVAIGRFRDHLTECIEDPDCRLLNCEAGFWDGIEPSERDGEPRNYLTGVSGMSIDIVVYQPKYDKTGEG